VNTTGHGIDSRYEVGRNCTVRETAASHPEQQSEGQQPAAQGNSLRGSSQPPVKMTRGAAASRPGHGA